MTTREEAKRVIMAEVDAALSDDDLLTVERIMARLSHKRIEHVISEAVSEAVDTTDEISLALAKDFAERRADIREATKARQRAL